MTRAIKGGEIGMNGEAYEGGQFLPNTTLPKREAKRLARAATQKQEIAPYTWAAPPTPGLNSIYRRIAGTTAQWKVFGKEFQPFWPYLSQQSQEAQDEAVNLIALWNAGERREELFVTIQTGGERMDLEALRAAIVAKRYIDTDNIYCEVDGTYGVSAVVRSSFADGVWVDTVGGFRQRWGF